MELDNLLWKDDSHIQVKKLWEYLTTYCYLPRLANFSVLESAIRAGVASDEAFAIASSISDDRYSGLRYNTSVMEVYSSDYLVKVLTVLKQLNQEKQEQQGTAGTSIGDDGYTSPASPGGADRVGKGIGGGPATPQPQPQVGDTRFFMSVKLDNTRVIRDLQKYLDEVVTHLSTTDNCDVKLSLEVSANAPDGFAPETVRTVSENCRTLRVDNFGFDK